MPYRYLTSVNSYLNYYGGYINQNAWMNWKPGELLYMGYKPIRYTPPVQGLVQLNTGSSGYVNSSEKWCDIELTFLRTSRKLSNAAEKYGSLRNGNWIQAGHNLLPWAGDRKFHYATRQAAGPGHRFKAPVAAFALWQSTVCCFPTQTRRGPTSCLLDEATIEQEITVQNPRTLRVWTRPEKVMCCPALNPPGM